VTCGRNYLCLVVWWASLISACLGGGGINVVVYVRTAIDYLVGGERELSCSFVWFLPTWDEFASSFENTTTYSTSFYSSNSGGGGGTSQTTTVDFSASEHDCRGSIQKLLIHPVAVLTSQQPSVLVELSRNRVYTTRCRNTDVR